MEASEIVRRNEAIARFTGQQVSTTLRPGEHGGHIRRPEELEYHSQWNWLMPAVEKILRDTGAMFGSRRDELFDNEVWYFCWFRAMPYGRLENDLRGMAPTMIEATWIVVSDYCLSLEPES